MCTCSCTCTLSTLCLRHLRECKNKNSTRRCELHIHLVHFVFSQFDEQQHSRGMKKGEVRALHWPCGNGPATHAQSKQGETRELHSLLSQGQDRFGFFHLLGRGFLMLLSHFESSLARCLYVAAEAHSFIPHRYGSNWAYAFTFLGSFKHPP